MHYASQVHNNNLRKTKKQQISITKVSAKNYNDKQTRTDGQAQFFIITISLGQKSVCVSVYIWEYWKNKKNSLCKNWN